MEKIFLGAAFTALLATCVYMMYSMRNERKHIEKQVAINEKSRQRRNKLAKEKAESE